ncbi:hypothetical protein D3C76_1766080 [compost metagenome]
MYRTPDSTRTVAFPGVLTLRLPAAVEVELVIGADQVDDEAGSSAGGGNRCKGVAIMARMQVRCTMFALRMR